MKKFLYFVIFCVIIIATASASASCSKKEEPVYINLEDLAVYLQDKTDLSNTMDYPERSVKDRYGIDTETDTSQLLILIEMDVNSAEGLFFAEAADDDKAAEIKEKLERYRKHKLDELRDYTANPKNAEQYAIVENAEIITDYNYIFWAVYENSKDINAEIKNYIKNLRGNNIN